MKKIILGIAIAIAVTVGLLAGTAKADSTKIVASTNMATSFGDLATNPTAWFFYNDENDTIDNTLGSFVVGPATPPLGTDSVQISVTGTQRRNLATYQFSGTPLASITELKFSTYNPSAGNGGSINRSGYLNFNVDFNGSDTWQKRLVFLPTDNGTVIQNSWQEWNATNGGNALWRYSGATWPSTAISGTTPRTWSDIITSYPGVRVRVTDSWLGIRVGEPYADGYTENIDAFKFGVGGNTTTFNFEEIYPVSGLITNPVNDGDSVSGTFNFTATYNDGDAVNDDAVQWAIRQGTCAAGVGTVAGNVDSFSNPFTWDGASFGAMVNTSGFTPGNYCFVFNPTDDEGQNDVREIRNFVVDAVNPNPFPVPAQCDQNIAYNLIEGNNSSNVINGTNGNDLILAKGGSDKVDGKGGNDCIVGGAGSDKLVGGNGDDVILGGADSDSIEGNNDADKLYGEGASDSIKGGSGTDQLYGGDGSDSLKGDSGDDMLDGGAGSDSANGGTQTDTCVAESKNSCEL